MSDVKRFNFSPDDFGAAGDGITDCTEAFRKSGCYVMASDFDAAQSELAALREELAAAKQRNAESADLLQQLMDNTDPWAWGADEDLRAKIEGFLKAAESGASE